MGRQPLTSGWTEERLRKLQRLYDQGLITRDEYDKKRAEILAEKW